jgi:hypothetical protein
VHKNYGLVSTRTFMSTLRYNLAAQVEYKLHFLVAYVNLRDERGLKHGLLGLLVRIPPRQNMWVVSVVCFQVDISATRRSLNLRGPTEYGVSECDREKRERRSNITNDTDPRTKALLQIQLIVCKTHWYLLIPQELLGNKGF